MSQVINFIKLDFNRSNNVTIPTIEWDQGSRFVRVQLQNNHQNVDITGSQVVITVIRNDLEEIIESCNILNAKDGLIEFEISKSMVARQGDMLCQLKLSDNDSLLSSQLFKVSVNNTLMVSLEESRSDMDVLIHALGEVQDIDNRFNKTNYKIDENYQKVNAQLSKMKKNIERMCIDFVDYGGIADGVTDNREKLQQLVDELHASGGGSIYIPDGTYYFANQITWRSNVSLFGAGRGRTILKTGGHTKNGFALFRSVRANPIKNCTFKDFTQDAYEQTIDFYSHEGKSFYFQDCENCIWENLELKGTPATALGVDGLSHCHISNILTLDCGRLWEESWHGADGTRPTSTKGPGGAGIGIGTGLKEIENLTISDCICINSGHFGIFIENQAIFDSTTYKYNSRGITITNCVAIGGKYAGFGIRSGKNITISNCASYENKHGIYLDAGTNQKSDVLKLENVIISGCTISDNTTYGIVTMASCDIDGLLITDCVIKDNENHGVLLGSTGSRTKEFVYNDINIDGCVISSNLAGVALGDYARIKSISVTNCTIMNNTDCGIKDANNYSEYISINDCLIAKNAKQGVLIDASKTFFLLENNEIVNNEGYGFEVTKSSSNIRIFGNTIKNNVGIAIKFAGNNKFIEIKSNTLSDTQDVKTQVYGLYLQNTFVNSTVMYNEILGNSQKSIEKVTTDSTDTLIKNNILEEEVSPTISLSNNWVEYDNSIPSRIIRDGDLVNIDIDIKNGTTNASGEVVIATIDGLTPQNPILTNAYTYNGTNWNTTVAIMRTNGQIVIVNPLNNHRLRLNATYHL